ncbi:hypothetical protein RCH09_000181 [Actimicrobium sp. GrIS 1.19]|uniref:SHOCT domain-containing protein n=1 Tax=Actimicrobium sp. GrIS 1.19 TaxID=3071708 RepID=UPI002E03B5EA|nr:hypothetical protein [Actimicrobium sp. GrIS 1.19]
MRLITLIAPRLLPTLFGLSLLGAAPFAGASTEGARYEACASCSPRDMAWSEGEFDQIYLTANPGPANLQPQELPVDTLSHALLLLKVESKGKPVGLFDDDSASSLARGLALALAKAGPQQDVIFFVVSRGNSGVLGTKVGTSGRAFIDRTGLNLIVGEAQTDFIGAYRATRRAREFNFGSRAKASKVVLSSEGMQHPRTDSVILSVTPNTPKNTILAPAMPTQYQPAPVAAPLPVARDDKFYAAQEERLKALKRLRAQDLITEEEYAAKRADILKSL